MTYEEALEQYRQWCLMVKLHKKWVKAQMNGGYRAPVIEWKSGKVIDPGSPAKKEDGLVRH